MTLLQRITGEIHWDTSLDEGIIDQLLQIAPASAFLTTSWLDLTRTTPPEKAAVFELLHALAPYIQETEGCIELAYTGLEFEFFTIKDARLYREDAYVQWEAKQLVHQETKLNYAGSYEYTGMLKLPRLDNAQYVELHQLIKRYGTPYYEAETNRIIFRHTTDDFNRWYTKMLAELARIVGETRGYVICELHPKDPAEKSVHFERYQMLEGQVLVQQGDLQRELPQAIPT